MPINFPNNDIEDEILISDFNKGDVNAFNVLIRRYQKKIYWIIRKMVLDHDDADDLTQEVCLKLYRSLNEFRGESKFFTYVYRIAINYSLNHLKRNSKINNRKVDLSNISIIDTGRVEYFDDKKKSKILEDAINSLPVQQRAVFNMRYYDNLSYEDISKIMNKSAGGMKANYFHALKNLKKFLTGQKADEILDLK